VSCVRKQNRCEVKRQCCKFFGASVFVIVEITVLYVYTLIKTISNIKIKHAQVSDCATYSDSAAWCDVSNSTKDTRQCTHQLRVGVETCRESRWSLTDRRIQGQTLLLITCLLAAPLFLCLHNTHGRRDSKHHPFLPYPAGMSSYDDDYQPRPRRHRDNRPPYPDDGPSSSAAFPTAPDAPPAATSSSSLPPPPLGSAIKQEGSRNRKAHLHPEFPDEASFLNTRSHDLERKNRPDERRFREKRDGYESDEGERHRKAATMSSRKPRYDDEESELPPRSSRRRGEGDMYGRAPPRDDQYEDRDRRRPPPRRRDDDDESLPPRRKGPRDGVEYGADPIKPKRRQTERELPRRRERDDDDRRRRDKYEEYSDEDDYRPRRRRSEEPPRRKREDRYDDYDEAPRRRRDDVSRRDEPDRRRDRDRSRRRHSDDDYDDRRGGRDRDRAPKEIKVGKYDVGPWLEKGQKYYGVVAPIVTPMIMNYMRKKK
jgi:hypothetical protein